MQEDVAANLRFITTGIAHKHGDLIPSCVSRPNSSAPAYFLGFFIRCELSAKSMTAPVLGFDLPVAGVLVYPSPSPTSSLLKQMRSCWILMISVLLFLVLQI